jgi:hypothetical protein
MYFIDIIFFSIVRNLRKGTHTLPPDKDVQGFTT